VPAGLRMNLELLGGDQRRHHVHDAR
jgi:hypothetical protein